MANDKNLENGIPFRFSKTNQPQNRGRKPDKLKAFLEAYDLSSSDINAVLQNILFAYTTEDLKEIFGKGKKRNVPLFITFIMKLLTTSTAKGNEKPIAYCLDRMFGKPMQQVNMSLENDLPTDPAIRQQLVEALKKEICMTDTNVVASKVKHTIQEEQ